MCLSCCSWSAGGSFGTASRCAPSAALSLVGRLWLSERCSWNHTCSALCWIRSCLSQRTTRWSSLVCWRHRWKTVPHQGQLTCRSAQERKQLCRCYPESRWRRTRSLTCHTCKGQVSKSCRRSVCRLRSWTMGLLQDSKRSCLSDSALLASLQALTLIHLVSLPCFE